MYIITVRRITSGELLKQRNGFLIAEGYEPGLAASTRFALTLPASLLKQGDVVPNKEKWWCKETRANSSPLGIPVLQGKYREFLEIRPSIVITSQNYRTESAGWRRFPYSPEQGILNDRSGKLLAIRGNTKRASGELPAGSNQGPATTFVEPEQNGVRAERNRGVRQHLRIRNGLVMASQLATAAEHS
jgi:hypothetical protein